MNTRTWLLAAAATLIFAATAPVAGGNGATLLLLLAAGTLTIHNPLRKEKPTMNEYIGSLKTQGHYLVVEAENITEAEAAMNALAPGAWEFIYPAEDWPQSKLEQHFPAGPLPLTTN